MTGRISDHRLGAWIFSLLYEARGIATAAAGAAVTVYWVALFASRLGYAFLPSQVSPTDCGR